jgi:tetratricopeptide (TPR) repeat protein
MAAALPQLGYAESFPGCSSEPAKPRRLPALGQGLFKKLAPVDEMISPEADPKTGIAPEPNFKEGWRRLQAIVNRCDDCNPYEQAQLYNRAAYVNYSLDNVKEAISFYEKVAALSPGIPLSLEQQVLFTAGQLKASREDYKGALSSFKQWEKTCPAIIPADYYYMLAQIYYQSDDKASALSFAAKAVKLSEEKGQIPKEPWYRLQMALLVDKEDFKAATVVAEKIAVNYLTAKNLSQLAGLYGLIGKESEQRGLLDALNVMGGMDKEAEVRNLASLFQSAEAPYLAAKVLKSHLDKGSMKRTAKNLEYLGAALRQAQEINDSIPVMEQAAKLSSDGRLYAQLSAIYLDAEDFKKSIESANEALSKGGLKYPGEAYFYRGNAEMQMKRYGSAIESLKKARTDERFGKYAADLLRYVESEQAREEGLKKSQIEAGEQDKSNAAPERA